MTLRNNPDARGVVVSSVQEGKAAWTAGLRVGDAVLSIEGHPLDSVDRLVEYVSEAEGFVRMEVSALEWQVGRDSQPLLGLAAPPPPLVVVPKGTPNGTSSGRGKLPSSDAMFSPPPQLSPQLPQETQSPVQPPGKLTNHGRSPIPPPPTPSQQTPPPVAVGGGGPLPPTPNPTTTSSPTLAPRAHSRSRPHPHPHPRPHFHPQGCRSA